MIFKVRGGIPRFNRMLCRALDEVAPSLGVKGLVLSIHDTRAMYEEAGERWQNLEFVPCGSNAGIARRVLWECLRRPFDATLIGLLGMVPLAIAAGPRSRRGFGLIVHGTEAWEPLPPGRAAIARRARVVFSVSRYTADAFGRGVGLDPARIRILHNTLDPGFEADPSEVRAGPEHAELLSVARLWPEEKQKGVDVTLRAVARIAPRHPRLRYRIVGKGGEVPRLTALAGQLGLADRVVFEEDLTDAELAERYRRCTAFVLPSGQEGFGIVFLEAMRFAKPCIGGTPGGSPEVIAHERTGLIVPFGDEAALAAAIERLLNDPDEARRMGEAGRRRLTESFLYSGFREKVERYFAEWIGRDSG
jgi:glycosyltransferase involved in cell wall biosynthesis